MQCAGLLLVALATCVALQPSEAILPFFSSCCTEVSPHLSRRLLKMVHTCHLQRADGDCDLDAVALYFGRRRFCVTTENHMLKEWMKAQAAKKIGQRIICREKKYNKSSSRGTSVEGSMTGCHKTSS
nr:C-C motif chemokine 28 [Oryctolagus cuniculus]